MSEQEQLKAQELRLEKNLAKIKNTIIILSGKGGDGKTTVAVNLAYGLAQKGYSVGILDVDIHGPNIAKMLGIEEEILYTNGTMLEPILVMQNLKAMSIALLGHDKDMPIIWRGPLKMAVIKQFLSDVKWGELDYLIVDSPPGTGDEPLSVCQLIKGVDGALIVTTPQDVAILDARKSIMFTKELHVPVLGIIENMSGFICPHCGKEIELFGSGGVEKAAIDLNVPFLGRFPFEPDIVKSGDMGKPFLQDKNNSETAGFLKTMIENILQSLNKVKK